MTLSRDGQWLLHIRKKVSGGDGLGKQRSDIVEKNPEASAAKALIRNMYMHGDVLEYMAGKYDIKGEIRIGEILK